MFKKLGASVVVIGRNEIQLHKLVTELKELNTQVINFVLKMALSFNLNKVYAYQKF